MLGATISAEQSNQQLSFRTTGGEAVRIKADGKVGVGTDNPATVLHIADDSADPYLRIGGNGRDCGIQLHTGNNFVAMRTDAADRLWINAKSDTIRFTVGGSSSSNEKLRIASDGDVSIGSTANALRRLDVVGNSLLVRPTIDNVSSSGNASAVNNSIIIRMPYGQNPGSTNHGGARFGIQFTGANNTTDVSSLNWGNDPVKSASIYGVSEDNLGYNRKVGLAFYTSSLDAAQSERLRITNDGKLLVGIHTTSEAYTWSPMARFAVQTSGDASSIHLVKDMVGLPIQQ